MPSLAHGSVLISLVVVLFAALLIATPPLALMSLPHDAPQFAPVQASNPSALA